jgi:hypothetical protein
MNHARSLFAVIAALLAIPVLMSLIVTAQSNMILRGNTGGLPPPPGGGCAESTAFLARTSALGSPYTTAYDNTICHLVSNGVWAKFNNLWILATKSDGTTPRLNLKSASFTLTENGSPNHAVNDGYLGVEGSSTVFLNTNYNAAAGGAPYTTNSASMGVWILNNFVSPSVPIGSIDGALANTYVLPRNTDGVAYASINSQTTSNTTSPGAFNDSTGFWIINRVDTVNQDLYRNGALMAHNGASTVGNTPNLSNYLLAVNFNGAASGSGYRLMAAFFGGTLTSGDVTNFYSVLCADFMIPVRGSCS